MAVNPTPMRIQPSFQIAWQQMGIPSISSLRLPRTLQWWQWCKLGGIAALVALVATIFVPHPLVVAIALHWICDLTVQSGETAMRKKDRGRHLALHSLVAGLPMAIAGMMVSPLHVLVWATVGIISHYAVDWTRKFGLGETMVGFVVDQIAHLAAIVVIILVG